MQESRECCRAETAPPKPEKQQPLFLALELLLNEVHYMEEVVEALEMRMSQIMGPAEPCEESNKRQPKTDCCSNVTETVYQAVDRLMTARNRICTVLSRVEI